MNPEKQVGTESFQDFINQSTLEQKDKTHIKFITEHHQGKHPSELTSRSYLFTGDVGVGKTHFVLRLLEAIHQPTIYMASAALPLKNAVHCSSFKDLISKMKSTAEQIIFLDDLECLFEMDDNGEIISKDKRDFMTILDMIKSNPHKILLGTINNLCILDERMVDRIEVKIEVDLPSAEHKAVFLQHQFSKYLPEPLIKHISNNSIGYNYRDLPEMVKMAYRCGESTLSLDTIKEALRSYRPTQLYGFKVHNVIETTLKDIVGKEQTVKVMKRVMYLHQHEMVNQRLGLKSQNLLLFHGPPGTGKTFMARAFAGEIGYPVISITADNFDRPSRIRAALNLAKRYRNCILFIDEAEKMCGNTRFGEDNPLIGEFNRVLDSLDGKGSNAIIILAVNELSRFGDALRDRFILLPFELPSYEERLYFCQKKGEHSDVKIDYEELARKTAGISFRELERIWSELMYHYLDHQEITGTIMNGILKGCASEPEHMFG